MSQPAKQVSPIEQLKKDLSSTQREVNDLQNKVNLSSIYDRLEDIYHKPLSYRGSKEVSN